MLATSWLALYALLICAWQHVAFQSWKTTGVVPTLCRTYQAVFTLLLRYLVFAAQSMFEMSMQVLSLHRSFWLILCGVKQMCAVLSDLWCLFSRAKLEGTKLQALSFCPSKQELQQFWKLCEHRLNAPGTKTFLVLLVFHFETPCLLRVLAFTKTFTALSRKYSCIKNWSLVDITRVSLVKFGTKLSYCSKSKSFNSRSRWCRW